MLLGNLRPEHGGTPYKTLVMAGGDFYAGEDLEAILAASQNKVFQVIKMQNTEKPNQRKYMFLVKTFLLRIVYIPCTSINI